MVSTYGALVFLVGAVAMVVIAAFVSFQSTEPEDPKSVTQKVYRVRSLYFFLLLFVLVLAYGFTLPKAPYFRDSSPDVVVDVVGKMWFWELKPVKGAVLENGDLVLPAGRKVEFRVTSADVNHGFGIYSPDGHILTQTQAMPGYTNHLIYTFKKPGIYRVFCMEFCGIGHHNMFARIVVRKEGE